VTIDPTNTTTTVADRSFEDTLPKRRLRLGSRTSHLARAYANRVVDALR
jgi:hydroxymethylbilane synthase